MPLLSVPKESANIIKTLVKNSPDNSLKESDLIHEAISFYYMYLSFLHNDKKLAEKFELLKVSDTPETTLSECQKEIDDLINHFSQFSYRKFQELEKVLTEKIKGNNN